MAVMKRFLAALAATTGAALLLPAGANAVLADIGTVPGEDVAPACPGSPCLAISRTTGYQAKVGDVRPVDVVGADGRLVAWAIRLGNPGRRQTAFFNENLGGEASAQITVLRPGRKLYHRVVAQGDVQRLRPYFGSTVQFALKESIPVKKGYVIALTVPTWAPALAVNQPATTSWRATRGKGRCNDFDAQTAQTGVNNITRAYCLYRTARLTYSATMVVDPQPTRPAPAPAPNPQGTAGSTGR
ncbi:MAG: hypothetical protein AVDCRST_MAG13-2913 [uncultured Solirubrobacteraceae bacterium]|uniref:Uncharacterized protein n=1 Tax=uncultured Solirubrobacteraceae bacterium TaxID=1162706 RepID=A0A6J4T4I0_9ACTN|nr:MAG: hypothetical protein AVDCRST_MAG13-2913 [uncultured Solirubrobacteraceae bacterium]